MRRVFALMAVILAAAALWGCGEDRPTSFQEFIFGTWKATSERNTFAEVTFSKGKTAAVGTYTAQIITGQDEETQEPLMADESGTIAISGSVIVITSPRFPQPLRFTWSVEDKVLTMQGDFGTETYRK